MTDLSSTERLIGQLFGDTARTERHDNLIIGEAPFDGQVLAVLGTVDQTYIGADAALAVARAVLDVMRDHPGRAILIIVDNSGHRLGRWDELVANNGCVAHLTKCLDLARRRGHRIIGLVNELAVSAGFMALGMSTDACYALPQAEVRVMALNAMSRVTKIPLDRLQELCETSPVLGPGVRNFVRVGALRGVWEGDPAEELRRALADDPGSDDMRQMLALERGGRTQAQAITHMVRAGLEA
jgi:malonate decarboxylase gamma subunit